MALKIASVGRGSLAVISANTFHAARTSPAQKSRRSRVASAEMLGVFPMPRTRASTTSASDGMLAARKAWSARRRAAYESPPGEAHQARRCGEAAGRMDARRREAKGRSCRDRTVSSAAAAKRAGSGGGGGDGDVHVRAWRARWHCREVLRRRARPRSASRRREAGRRRCREDEPEGRKCAVGS
jgi:hypothetical protein